MNYLIMGQLIDPKEYRDESLVSGAMTSHGMGPAATRTKRQFVYNVRTKPKMYREVGQGSPGEPGGAGRGEEGRVTPTTAPSPHHRNATPPQHHTTATPLQHP